MTLSSESRQPRTCPTPTPSIGQLLLSNISASLPDTIPKSNLQVSINPSAPRSHAQSAMKPCHLSTAQRWLRKYEGEHASWTMLPQRVSHAASTTGDPTASRHLWSARTDVPGETAPLSWDGLRKAPPPRDDSAPAILTRARRARTDCPAAPLKRTCW